MTNFTKIPEATNFIADQSWLSPDEPVTAAPRVQYARALPRYGWREAAREIADIFGRLGRT